MNLSKRIRSVVKLFLFGIIFFQIQLVAAQNPEELANRFEIKSPKQLFERWKKLKTKREDLYKVIKVEEWIVLFDFHTRKKPIKKDFRLHYKMRFTLAYLLNSVTRFNECIVVYTDLLENKRYLDSDLYQFSLLQLEESYIRIGNLKSGIATRKKRITEGFETNYWSIYREAGLYQQAIEEYKKYVPYSKTSSWQQIFYHLDLGDLYFKNADLDRALLEFEKGFTAANTICNKNAYKDKSAYSEYSKYYFRSLMSGNMAQIYLKRKQILKAIPLLKDDVEKSKSIEEIGNAMLKRLDLADCYLQLKQTQKAKLYLDTVSDLIKTTKIYYYDFRFFELKATYFKAANEYDSASVYLSKYIAIKENLNEKNRKNNVIGLLQFFDSEKQKAQIVKQNLALTNEKLKLAEERIRRNIFIALAIILAGLSLGLFFYSKQKSKRKTEAEKSLREKEILLKEIHHRVKNNLTTLKSLLFLQGRASSNEEVKRVLKECETRIHSMALIHQNLYQDSENGDISFLQFIKELFQNLEISYNKNKLPPLTHIKFDEIYLEMSKGLFLGLIINELATNSYKYAFTNDKLGEINVDLRLKGDVYSLYFEDNGPGLSEAFENYTSGFGFRLIRILVDQVDGEIQYTKTNNSSTFLIRFHA